MTDRMRVGMDLGTSSTALVFEGKNVYLPTVVGFAKPGVLPGLLPGKRTVLFGEEALVHHSLVDLVWPIRNGTVADPKVAALFAEHVASLVDPSRRRPLYVVVGTPAHATGRHTSMARQALVGSFHKVQFYPEPFLVVMGLRGAGPRAPGAGEGEVDPALNSMVVDIGAGTTDVTIVQGTFPGHERQRSRAVAGDEVDRQLSDRLHHLYPDLDMPMTRVTRLKEQHAYVGDPGRSISVRYPVLGKPQDLEIGEAVREACGILVPVCYEIVSELLAESPPELVEGLQQNVILAGGGSRIQGLDQALQARLRAAGFAQATVHKVRNYQYLVAQGALVMAEQSRETDWQNLLGQPREKAGETQR